MTSLKKIIIYGASYGDIIKLIDAINRAEPSWTVVGFIDDTRELRGKSFMGYEILGGRELIPDLALDEDVYWFNNVNGSRDANEKIAGILDSYHCKLANLVHPSIDMNYVSIGRGCIIPDGCVIGANVTLGDFVTLRYGSVLSHDVEIGDFVLIGPGVTVGGRARIERGCLIGASATILLETAIGENSTVGAGTVVIRDVSACTTVAGVPGREIKREQGGN